MYDRKVKVLREAHKNFVKDLGKIDQSKFTRDLEHHIRRIESCRSQRFNFADISAKFKNELDDLRKQLKKLHGQKSVVKIPIENAFLIVTIQAFSDTLPPYWTVGTLKSKISKKTHPFLAELLKHVPALDLSDFFYLDSSKTLLDSTVVRKVDELMKKAEVLWEKTELEFSDFWDLVGENSCVKH